MSTSDTLLLIQARMGSSRLPGKVLLPLGDHPLIVHMTQRLKKLPPRFSIKVIIPNSTEDDLLARVLDRYQIDYFRGHPTDLLDRHWKACEPIPVQSVIKIPSDCPLIDPSIVELVANAFYEHPGKYDYVSNLHPQSFADGNDVEVMSKEALYDAWMNAKLLYEKEHTTPFFWMSPGKFRTHNIKANHPDLSRRYRYTLDYEPDYKVIRSIYDHFNGSADYSYQQILDFLESHPEVSVLNEKYLGYTWYGQEIDPKTTSTPEALNALP